MSGKIVQKRVNKRERKKEERERVFLNYFIFFYQKKTNEIQKVVVNQFDVAFVVSCYSLISGVQLPV